MVFAAYFDVDGQDGEHNLVDSFPRSARRFQALFGA